MILIPPQHGQALTLFFLFLAGLASSAATLLLRRAGLATGSASFLQTAIPHALILRAIALGFYGCGFIAYAHALKSVSANIAYPAMTGMTLVLTLAGAYILLGEAIGPRVLLGCGLILAGVVLVGAGSGR